MIPVEKVVVKTGHAKPPVVRRALTRPSELINS